MFINEAELGNGYKKLDEWLNAHRNVLYTRDETDLKELLKEVFKMGYYDGYYYGFQGFCDDEGLDCDNTDRQ